MSSGPDGNLGEFLAEAEEILEALSSGVLALESTAAGGESDPEVINAVFRGAHSLKGISAMCGFAQLTELSHKLETLLDAVRMGRVGCDRGTVDLLLGGVALLQKLCAKLSQGGQPEDEAVGPFVGRLLAASEGKPTGAGGELDALGLPPESLQVLSEYEVHRLRETLKSRDRNLLRVRASFAIDTFDTDLDALNQALKSQGEIISTLPSAGTADADRLDFDLLVGSKRSADEVSEAIQGHGASVVGLAPPGRSRKPEGEPAAVEAPSIFSGAIPAPPAPEAANPDAEDLRSISRTVRVDLAKLDGLMNLVGELVLTKGRIQLLSARLRERTGYAGEALELSKVHKEFERRLGELQQSVMDVRMVPLGQLFSKLHRLVRRLLQGSPKEVALEISGAETELDKLIVEDLSDPLIHVIRNAIDHGIEEPEVRERAGKPRRGRISISATQSGNHVVISVSDDGAGLSRARIRRKAEERGLLAPGAAIGDRELLDLVFLPGFSTKEEVTELSGRGVGMDVLRKNVSRLSGIIELSSREGEGTTVAISLPITLAIIQALVVRSGDQTYAIPLSCVLETLSVDPRHVRGIEGRPVLRLRDNTLPLVRVDRILGEASGAVSTPYAVVVGAAEKRVAFGVDDLVSQQDVVIKALGRRLDRLRGLAGATDLGDQRIVPVLDVPTLVEEVLSCH